MVKTVAALVMCFLGWICSAMGAIWLKSPVSALVAPLMLGLGLVSTLASVTCFERCEDQRRSDKASAAGGYLAYAAAAALVFFAYWYTSWHFDELVRVQAMKNESEKLWPTPLAYVLWVGLASLFGVGLWLRTAFSVRQLLFPVLLWAVTPLGVAALLNSGLITLKLTS